MTVLINGHRYTSPPATGKRPWPKQLTWSQKHAHKRAVEHYVWSADPTSRHAKSTCYENWAIGRRSRGAPGRPVTIRICSWASLGKYGVTDTEVSKYQSSSGRTGVRP